jgi:hypothetical protein
VMLRPLLRMSDAALAAGAIVRARRNTEERRWKMLFAVDAPVFYWFLHKVNSPT